MRPLALALLVVSGCAAASSSDWHPLRPSPRSAAEILATAREVVEREGFKIESSDESTITSAWRESWDVQSRRGLRERVEVQVQDAPEGRVALVAAWRQINYEIGRTFVGDAAGWQSDGQSHTLATRLRMLLESRLFGAGGLDK